MRKAAEAERDLAQVQLEEEREHMTRLQERVRHLEESAASDRSALDEERQRTTRLNNARRAEREWAAEMRRQVMDLQDNHSVLGDDTHDVRELVLRVAIDLADAEKGLLLAQADEDADGALDLVCALGFDNDPEHSAVWLSALPGEVMERDQTVREDERLGSSEKRGTERRPTRRSRTWWPSRCTSGERLARRRGSAPTASRAASRSSTTRPLLALGDHAGTALHNSRLHGELRTSNLSTVQMLADAIEAKDPFLRAHSDEVSDYVAAVADRLEAAAAAP